MKAAPRWRHFQFQLNSLLARHQESGDDTTPESERIFQLGTLVGVSIGSRLDSGQLGEPVSDLESLRSRWHPA